MLKDKPPSSGTCKFELGTHLSHSNPEVHRVAAPPEIRFSFAEGVGLDLSDLVSLLSSVIHVCDREFSDHLSGGRS
jgi:hypothetical protein